MRFCVIMAFFDKGNTFRKRNLAEVVKNYLTTDDFDVIIAEQYPNGFAEAIANRNPDRVKFVPCHELKGDPQKKGVFCKTELLNAAVKAYPDYEYYVMGDADALLPEESFCSLRESVSLLDSGDASIVFPFDDVLYLNEPDTRRVIAGEPLLPGTKDHGAEIFRQTGLCNIFKKSTWVAVGGFDEAFRNWGAEDDAFLTKCTRLVGDSRRLKGTMRHLFHPKVNTDAYCESKEYVDNRRRCACVRRMTMDDLKRYAEGKVGLNELVEKYDALGRLSVQMKWQCTPVCLLTLDTTIYDIRDEGDMSFTKLLDAVAAEYGKWYVPVFINTSLGGLNGIPGLSDAQKKELKDYMERCSS